MMSAIAYYLTREPDLTGTTAGVAIGYRAFALGQLTYDCCCGKSARKGH